MTTIAFTIRVIPTTEQLQRLIEVTEASGMEPEALTDTIAFRIQEEAKAAAVRYLQTLAPAKQQPVVVIPAVVDTHDATFVAMAKAA